MNLGQTSGRGSATRRQHHLKGAALGTLGFCTRWAVDSRGMGPEWIEVVEIDLRLRSLPRRRPWQFAMTEIYVLPTNNQFNILNAIRRSGLISRVEIAQLTGQSRAAVTNVTAHLIKEGTILEKQTNPSGSRGRRRVMLALNPSAAYVVGVKLSAFQLSFAVTNMQADVISSLTVPVRIGKRSAEFVTDLMEEGIRHCVAKAKLGMEMISGIGVGIPGFVDSRKGITYWSPLYRQGNSYLKDLIQDRFKIPTYIENDANTVTLAEQWFGEGMGVDNFIVVTVEHGVGMGIVVNGQIYRGERGIGAEFGHLVIRPGGEPCRCGKRGCIESYVADYKVLEAGEKPSGGDLLPGWGRRP